MNIECILRRTGGTKADIDGIQYHFAELEDGAHVANVEQPTHIDRFLSIADAYRVYHGTLETKTAPVKLAQVTSAAAVPEATPDMLNLVGSNVHPPSFDIGGVTYSLGDVVRKAFKDSGLTFDEWNEMLDDDRHARIDMALDDLAEAHEKAAVLGPQDPVEQASSPASAEPQTRDEWAAAYLAKFGKLPHHNASIETIKAKIAQG